MNTTQQIKPRGGTPPVHNIVKVSRPKGIGAPPVRPLGRHPNPAIGTVRR